MQSNLAHLEDKDSQLNQFVDSDDKANNGGDTLDDEQSVQGMVFPSIAGFPRNTILFQMTHTTFSKYLVTHIYLLESSTETVFLIKFPLFLGSCRQSLASTIWEI